MFGSAFPLSLMWEIYNWKSKPIDALSIFNLNKIQKTYPKKIFH